MMNGRFILKGSNHMDIDLVEEEFKKYVNTFDMSNKNIMLKYEHTFEVVKIIEKIARRLNLNAEQITLSKIIAYLHDIGRFEQIVETNTFKDIKMDHADNGADLLFKRGLIKNFKIEEKYYHIIDVAIRNHNKLEIENDLNQEEKLFVKLIRDADKIDIYRVRHKYERETDIFGNVPQEYKLRDFYDHKSINIKDNKTKSDSLLCVISFVYDMNFEESIDVLKELGYFQKFINGITVTTEQEELFLAIKKEIYKFLDIREEDV